MEQIESSPSKPKLALSLAQLSLSLFRALTTFVFFFSVGIVLIAQTMFLFPGKCFDPTESVLILEINLLLSLAY